MLVWSNSGRSRPQEGRGRGGGGGGVGLFLFPLFCSLGLPVRTLIPDSAVCTEIAGTMVCHPERPPTVLRACLPRLPWVDWSWLLYDALRKDEIYDQVADSPKGQDFQSDCFTGDQRHPSSLLVFPLGLTVNLLRDWAGWVIRDVTWRALDTY